MASITIRNIDDSLKALLRIEAANNNRSMEEQARVILRRALVKAPARGGLGSRIHSRFAQEGVDLELSSRAEPPRGSDLFE
ncbi:FitA-like ribbon-helix-helix domain-containing protein [Pseudomonas sp. TE3610]